MKQKVEIVRIKTGKNTIAGHGSPESGSESVRCGLFSIAFVLGPIYLHVLHYIPISTAIERKKIRWTTDKLKPV